MMVSWNHAFANLVVFLLTLRHAGAAQRKQQRTLLRPRADLLEQHPFLATIVVALLVEALTMLYFFVAGTFPAGAAPCGRSAA
jgi:hypothetical protein